MTRPVRIVNCEQHYPVLDVETNWSADVVLVEGAKPALSLLRRAPDHLARKCLIICIQQRPLCVVLDLDVHGSAGLEVCQTIRAAPEATDTIIVLVTAQKSVKSFDAALLASADEILLKPFPNLVLLARVEAALQTNMHSRTELRGRCQRLREQRAALEAEEAPRPERTAVISRGMSDLRVSRTW